jgi:hypothetical protein
MGVKGNVGGRERTILVFFIKKAGGNSACLITNVAFKSTISALNNELAV